VRGGAAQATISGVPDQSKSKAEGCAPYIVRKYTANHKSRATLGASSSRPARGNHTKHARHHRQVRTPAGRQHDSQLYVTETEWPAASVCEAFLAGCRPQETRAQPCFPKQQPDKGRCLLCIRGWAKFHLTAAGRLLNRGLDCDAEERTKKTCMSCASDQKRSVKRNEIRDNLRGLDIGDYATMAECPAAECVSEPGPCSC